MTLCQLTPDLAQHPITTRAHLLDIPRYLEKNGKPALEPLGTKTPITIDILKACAADNGIKFAPGDCLMVRTGYTEAVEGMTDAEREKYDPMHGAIGVDPSEETMEWIWENGIAAVASDA